MKFSYYGHSCFSMEFGGAQLLFDPFISPNPLASAISLKQIKADYILISHAHEDHTADALSLLKQTGALLISNYEIVTWFQKQGIKKVHGMNIGGSFEFPFGRVKMVGAIHSSSFADGSYGGNPAGFVVDDGRKAFYYAGDSALTLDMRLIADQHELDVAILPIGDNFTMGPDDAALAATYCGAGHVVGVHYDTFPHIVIDQKSAREAFEVMDIELLLPAIGESITFD